MALAEGAVLANSSRRIIRLKDSVDRLEMLSVAVVQVGSVRTTIKPLERLEASSKIRALVVKLEPAGSVKIKMQVGFSRITAALEVKLVPAVSVDRTITQLRQVASVSTTKTKLIHLEVTIVLTKLLQVLTRTLRTRSVGQHLVFNSLQCFKKVLPFILQAVHYL